MKIYNPFRLSSFLYWQGEVSKEGKSLFEMSLGDWMKKNKGTCRVCEGAMRGTADDGNVYFCICSMLGWLERQEVRNQKYESQWTERRLQELKVKEVKAGEQAEVGSVELINMKNSIGRWMKNPLSGDISPWGYIQGRTGCGKSHTLMSIKRYWRQLAFYISAEDFSAKMKGGMNKNASYTVEDVLTHLVSTPILLIDDIGLQYENEKAFTLTKLVEVVNRRLSITSEIHANMLPTFITSNISIQEFLVSANDSAKRFGSRMSDPRYSTIYDLPQEDYRVVGARK